MSESIQIARAAVPLTSLLGGVFGGPLRAYGLTSSANCVRERLCVDGVGVYDGDVHMVCVKSWWTSRSF